VERRVGVDEEMGLKPSLRNKSRAVAKCMLHC
jgi:hypothetical protein